MTNGKIGSGELPASMIDVEPTEYQMLAHTIHQAAGHIYNDALENRGLNKHQVQRLDDARALLRGLDSDTLHRLSIAEVLEMDTREPMALPGVAVLGGVTVLHSEPKAGKSLLVWSGISEIARRGSWWGLPAPESKEPPTIEVWTEEPPHLLRQKLLSVGLTDQSSGHVVLSSMRSESQSQWDGLLDSAARTWRMGGAPDVLIVDTVGTWAMAGADVQDYGAMAKMFNSLRDFLSTTGVAALLTHHTRKGAGSTVESSLGSQAVAGMVDGILQLERVAGEPTHRKLSSATRWSGHETATLAWFEGEGEYRRLSDDDQPSEEDMVRAAVMAIGEPVTAYNVEAFIEGEGQTPPKLGRIKSILKTGDYTIAGKDGRTYQYTI